MKHSEINKLTEELDILTSCTQTGSTDISNLFEMLDQQLALAIEDADALPEDQKVIILKHIWFMDTMLRQIRTKVNDNFFWAVGNVVFELNKEIAS